MSHFGGTDWSIFFLTLSFSAAIGIYFACFAKKKGTANEYLYGNRKMKAIPVGLSLYSSAISAVSLLGVPTEVYLYGTQYVMCSIGTIFAMFIIWYTLLPVFCGNIQIKTPYEYFEQRFNVYVKLLSLLIYIIYTLLMMPIILYAPSMAISKATDIPLVYCTVVICGTCIAYTTVGGFKTVIWTDALQATLMLLSYLFVAIVGLNRADGLANVWSKAEEGNRIEFFNWDPNPLTRTTFWTTIIGLTFIHTSHSGCSAGALQRYMSLPHQRDARISNIVGVSGTILVQIIGGLIGLAMFTIYFNCDPLQSKEITSKNQLLPYFVTKTIDSYPGFSGFFFAGLLSAALSTLSSELNVLGGIIYYDFVLRYFKSKFTESRATFTIKIIIVINGLIYLCIVPIVHKEAKHLYELAISFGSITYGAKLSMLMLGVLFPKTNSKGVITGAIVSIAAMCWINYGAHTYQVSEYSKKPMMNCTNNNFTISEQTNLSPESEIFFLYRISYLYYCLVGTIISIVVAISVSYLTGPNNVHDINPSLIVPYLRPYHKNDQKDNDITNKFCTEM